MNLLDLISQRRSVRSYLDKHISDEELKTIKESLVKINDILIASMTLEFNKVMTKYN